MSDKNTVLDTSHNPTENYTPWQKILLLFYILLFILIIFAPNTWMEGQIKSEISSFNAILGAHSGDDVFSRANNWWQSTVIKFDLEQKTYDIVMPTSYEMKTGIGKAASPFFDGVANSLRNFWLMVYQSFYRASVMVFWIMFAFGLILAGITDGYYKRQIKRYNFGWSSANVFRISFRYLVLIPTVLGLYLSIPVIPDYIAYMPVLIYLGMAVALSYMVSNMNKVF